MTITQVTKIDRQIVVLFDDGVEGFTLAKWGEQDVYSTVSDGILKSQILQYKEDALEYDFNVNKLKKVWNIK